MIGNYARDTITFKYYSNPCDLRQNKKILWLPIDTLLCQSHRNLTRSGTCHNSALNWSLSTGTATRRPFGCSLNCSECCRFCFTSSHAATYQYDLIMTLKRCTALSSTPLLLWKRTTTKKLEPLQKHNDTGLLTSQLPWFWLFDNRLQKNA